ncbi:hypothetical protein DPMN_026021 [Dreissena polymorpha]|uniref:Uncharacterized protein n=1 Tax=Dreissena polymorpha TaxID=45954 RepID=A0A9D4LQB0_DREPO|nr:hypothetical protein DPMN_026021 [Dreissena polymorpha]
MGRLFNEPKDKADILNRQYESVFTQENQEHVSCPPGTTRSIIHVGDLCHQRGCREVAAQNQFSEGFRT